MQGLYHHLKMYVYVFANLVYMQPNGKRKQSMIS